MKYEIFLTFKNIYHEKIPIILLNFLAMLIGFVIIYLQKQRCYAIQPAFNVFLEQTFLIFKNFLRGTYSIRRNAQSGVDNKSLLFRFYNNDLLYRSFWEEVNGMNKTELINEVVAATEISKKDATKAVDAVFDTILEALKSGDKVQLIGFGNFEVRERAARKGRNPQTGEEIEIAASKVPAFKPGKALKDAVK